jgi:hypothetical protein
MNDSYEVPADDFEERIAEGRSMISKLWPVLQLSTRSRLMMLDDDGQAHFDSHGRKLGVEDSFGEIANVAYALGTMRLAVTAMLPSKGDDLIPSIFRGDDVKTQAAEMMYSPAGRDPEFAAMALHALLKQQTCLALEKVYWAGGTIDGPKLPKFFFARLWVRVVFTLIFAVSMPFALGYGLTFAFNGDAFLASVFACWGLFGFGYIRDAKKIGEPKELDELIAYRRWQELCAHDFHIGTAYGLEIKLKEMLRANIKMPSILFDLCAMTRGRAHSWPRPLV